MEGVSTLRDSGRHVIIVGGGASGVLLACQLLRDPQVGLRVTLVEPHAEVGRGVAYFTANPGHLLNVRAANMSAFPDQPDHFWRWLCARQPAQNGAMTWQPCDDPFCFVPRRIYGDYIASLIEPLLSQPGRLRIVRGKCVSIREAQCGAEITLADETKHPADIIVLATGHEASIPPATCYAAPWTAPSDAGIHPNAGILILGSGLTMIDYVLSLLLAGHHGPIVALSRRGLLPNTHRHVAPLRINPADVPFGSSVRLLRWLRTLAATQTARGGDWRSVVDGLRPFTQQIWQRLPFPARRSFLEHARAWWDVHRHRMAPEVAARINAAIAAGHLQVVAGRLSTVEPNAFGARVQYRPRGEDAVETIQVAKIIDCRGLVTNPLEASNPALRSLFAQGLARPDPLHIGIDVATDCAIIDQAGTPSERLFAVGPLTRAAFWEIVAVPDIRNQCVALARRIMTGLGQIEA